MCSFTLGESFPLFSPLYTVKTAKFHRPNKYSKFESFAFFDGLRQFFLKFYREIKVRRHLESEFAIKSKICSKFENFLNPWENCRLCPRIFVSKKILGHIVFHSTTYIPYFSRIFIPFFSQFLFFKLRAKLLPANYAPILKQSSY